MYLPFKIKTVCRKPSLISRFRPVCASVTTDKSCFSSRSASQLKWLLSHWSIPTFMDYKDSVFLLWTESFFARLRPTFSLDRTCFRRLEIHLSSVEPNPSLFGPVLLFHWTVPSFTGIKCVFFVYRLECFFFFFVFLFLPLCVYSIAYNFGNFNIQIVSNLQKVFG